MKKVLEVTLITIVSLSSAVATVAVVHDANAPKPNVVSTYLERLWSSLNDKWLNVQRVPSLSQQATPTFNQSSASAVSTTPTHQRGQISATTGQVHAARQVNATGQVTGQTSGGTSLQLSPADFQRLNQIVQKLLPALTPAEWSKLLSDLQSQDTAATTTDISNLLTKNLSSQDIAWLQSYFQGENTFSTKDVQLLQTAFNQLESSLTPSEQQMVLQQLSGFLRQH